MRGEADNAPLTNIYTINRKRRRRSRTMAVRKITVHRDLT
jgi:hypothetical protein